MSSDEPIVSSTGHHIEVAMINETDCPTIADNAANDRQSDRKSETAEANQSGPNCEVLVPAPPPRKLNRTGSVRRTNKTTDATDTAIASDQISDSSPPSDTHFKSGDNESASPVIITSRGATHEVPTTKSESTLKDNATQCVSTDLIGYKSNVNSYRIHPMERMRRWVTSDEAKEKRRQRLNRCLHYLKVFLAHLFSTTGLCLLVVAYSCAGAVIFTYVESPNEVKHRKTIEKERSECAHQIWNYTMEMNVIYPDLLSKEIDKRLAQFEKKVVKAVREGGYDGIGASEQWTFSGALLYSVTVITTIGYGNVTCQTALGRVVTMVYALFGIPVMFLCLANLGNLMAQTFRFSYRRICCFCCFAATNRCNKRKETKANKSSLNTQNEKIELKNCSPNANQKDIKLVFDESDDQKVRSIIELMPSTPPTVSSVSSSSISSPLKSQLSNDDHKEIVVVKENRVGSLESGEDRVPIWLVTLLVISYIMAGASMFSIWEGWDFDEGAYFCFTTLTTIGFGDFVPGSAKYSEDAQGQTKFIICCAYLIVGLSLLAMSFNLVQEEIVIKAKELGRKIGIISKSECDSSVSV